MIQSTMQEGALTITSLLEHSRKFFPEATVSTWTGTELRTATFGEIGDQSAQVAHALAKLGIGIGDRVATFMWNNNEHQVLYAAIPSMGAVLHTLNLRLSPEQAIYIMNHAEDKVVFVDASVAPLLQNYVPHAPSVKHVVVTNGPKESFEAPEGVTVHAWDELLAGEPTQYDWPELDERAAAAMCYTSGTTGDPKGVVYSHRSIYLHSFQVTASNGMALANDDTALVIVPMFHAMSWGMPYAALMSGSSLLHPDRFLQPEPLLAMMAAARPTMAAAVPTIWSGVSALLDAQPQDISHLREVVVGGSAVPPSMIRKFDEYGAPIIHAWGMTETSPLGSVARVPAGVTDDEEAFAYRVTQGRFPAPVGARIVDADGNVLPNDGETSGELEVSGPWITGAYYSPEGNVSDPSKFHDGWLRTGDVATISPDGYMTIVDRTKDIIKTGGEWISSVDLENTIAAHPEILECTVIGVPDPKWDERPFVLAVTTEGSTLDVPTIRAWLEERIPRWQVPERWSFGEEVPKTSVGKFDKKRVRQHYAEGLYEVVSNLDL
ncbi:putative fatty-acid--CoA ligase [Gordonia hirsuta DSM 44140 = NBRC 16056]|uniref:Putative fatty-acid--CoA ligase n=1 Tax=Gordonia hirsuta DSM 44140 = NBRC 16056 TaxID=1121927 RepID=L7L8F5_9ACTN|nr:long-chain fatty acid--CoA ligase [Gordonia hirsuta]GAC56313.1 putative fatty-acid--CoA ligase [Gordonia hirsuta DSM 44140 = NBRC 16056]